MTYTSSLYSIEKWEEACQKYPFLKCDNPLGALLEHCPFCGEKAEQNVYDTLVCSNKHKFYYCKDCIESSATGKLYNCQNRKCFFKQYENELPY